MSYVIIRPFVGWKPDNGPCSEKYCKNIPILCIRGGTNGPQFKSGYYLSCNTHKTKFIQLQIEKYKPEQNDILGLEFA
jgi:hypothetical protein